jgi:hypothetical protein
MLKEAFRDNALFLTQTYEWFTSFNEGRISVEYDERCGQPSIGAMTENTTKVRGYPGTRKAKDSQRL